MPLKQLNYVQTLVNPLGRACFEYRSGNNYWTKCNLAAMEIKLSDRPSYFTFVAASKPEITTHSEELIIEMFDQLNDISDSNIENMILYTEFKPCVTERKQVVDLMPMFDDYPLIIKAKQTIKHKGCKNWLAARFGEFQVYHTITSHEEHGNFLGWLKLWGAKVDLSLAIARRYIENPTGFKAAFYKCPNGHVSRYEPASGKLFQKCAAFPCSADAIIDGFQPVQ